MNASSVPNVPKFVPRETKVINDSVLILRNAIFTSGGKDKDITEGIAPLFLSYNRNGLNLQFEFSSKLSRAEANWAFELTKKNMESIYETSGYGWDDEDKMKELTEQGARFLLIRERCTSDATGSLVGFSHFRFTVQGEVMDQMAGEPCLFLWDLQLEDKIQRKGVGRHLITLHELIARRELMTFLSVPIHLTDKKSKDWISNVRGFKPDFHLKSLVGFIPQNEVKFLVFNLYRLSFYP